MRRVPGTIWFRASDLSKTSRKGKSRAEFRAAAAGIKQKSVASGDMCLEMTPLMAEVATILLEIESFRHDVFLEKVAAPLFRHVGGARNRMVPGPAGVSYARFRERAAPPVLVGVDVIRRAEVRFCSTAACGSAQAESSPMAVRVYSTRAELDRPPGGESCPPPAHGAAGSGWTG